MARMEVLWQGKHKLAPCNETDFDLLHGLWTEAYRYDVQATSKALQRVGYSKGEALELVVLFRRRDRREMVVVRK